ncbi:MAG: hypothetical protein WDM89_06180 [Rhizomicrobium sp.]
MWLPVVLPEPQWERLAAQARQGDFTIDLDQRSITAPDGARVLFDIDPLQREGLLEGLDEIGLTLRWAGDIATWQAADRAKRPWIWAIEKANNT